MSERPTSSFVVPLLIAVTVLGVGFGGGVLFGWRMRKRPPNSPENSTASMSDAEVQTALTACRRELKALTKARRAKPPTIAMPDNAGMEHAAKIEALQKEVQECRVRETLQNAYVCGTISEHTNFYGVLVHGTSCADPPGIGEYILNSFDRCAEFVELEGYPAHLDEDELTDTEKRRLFMSEFYRKVPKESEARGLQRIRRECRRIWALPPE